MAVRRVLRLCGRSNGMRGEGGGCRPPSMSAQGGGKPRASRSERGGGPRNGSAAAPVFAPVLELDTRLVVIIPPCPCRAGCDGHALLQAYRSIWGRSGPPPNYKRYTAKTSVLPVYAEPSRVLSRAETQLGMTWPLSSSTMSSITNHLLKTTGDPAARSK